LLVLSVVGVPAVGVVVAVAEHEKPRAEAAHVMTAAPVAPPAPVFVPETAPEGSPELVEAPKPAAAAEATPPAARGAFKREPVEAKTETRPTKSSLREEARLLSQAQTALGRGDVDKARAILEEVRTRFPESQLTEEREALEVRLADTSGDRIGASALARAFLQRHPESTVREGIDSIANHPKKE
jgi:hypothetical protein